MTQATKLGNVRILINPASGKKLPVLSILHEAMKDADLKWDVEVSKEKGDVLRLAKKAIREGVDAVAVYGGDGTLSEVVPAFLGGDVPLFILAGGSANVLATELGLPKDLKDALALLTSSNLRTRSIDVARFNGCYSVVRAGLGFEAEMVENADRETKRRLGVLAYFYSAFAAFKKTRHARYRLEIDGAKYSVSGWTCMVANAGNLGFTKISLDKHVDVSDGFLDVLVVRKANLSLAGHILATFVRRERPDNYELVEHWQGKKIKVTTDVRQVVQCDGEALGAVPFEAEVLPSAMKVLVPEPAKS